MRRRGFVRVRVAGVAAILAAAVLLPARGARALQPLSSVQNLTASVKGDEATVSWTAPANGTPARYEVHAWLNGTYNTNTDYGTRIVGPKATSITWDRMPFNQPVQFTVTPIGADGSGGVSGAAGLINATGLVTATNSYCPSNVSGGCIVVDTTHQLGTETRPGAGLLHGTVPSTNPSVARLNLTHWRIQANNATQYAQASAQVPPNQITEILSDAWFGATSGKCNGSAADPWADWTAYTNFITQTVQQADQAGQNPYWEIQNEPENYPYCTTQPPTRALVQQEYLKAYQAIKALDRNGIVHRVIGPSIDWQYENSKAPWYIDMKTFIAFAGANNMQLTAITWHDNSDGPPQGDQNPLIYQETPQTVRDHAQEVRELIAETPAIGNPQLFVNENSSASGSFIPGFSVGYFAAEDRASVDQGNHACWNYPGGTGPNGCFGTPTLGDLLTTNGNPSANYWATVDYGSMSGTRVWSETADTNMSVLAVNGSGAVTRTLVGRHQTCSGWTIGDTSYCPSMSPPPSPATTVNILVPLGATSATIGLQKITNTRADITTAPATTNSTVTVTNGLAQVAIPSFGDGEAYFITATPNATTGGNPPDGNGSNGESPPASGASTPTRLIIEAGNYQCATVLQTYPSGWVVLATDQYGNALTGASVRFSLPPNSATFSTGGTVYTGTTDTQGLVSSSAIQAGTNTNNNSYFAGAAQILSGYNPIVYFAFKVVLLSSQC
jgi:hypothetical protein